MDSVAPDGAPLSIGLRDSSNGHTLILLQSALDPSLLEKACNAMLSPLMDESATAVLHMDSLLRLEWWQKARTLRVMGSLDSLRNVWTPGQGWLPRHWVLLLFLSPMLQNLTTWCKGD